jgi:Mg2+-importing ATPase
MAPIQVLTNNLLYDFSQTTIPTDNVDEEYLASPQKWDIGNIFKFMVFIGPSSSIFDYATYGMMLYVFDSWNNPSLLQTGWFVESLLTQTLIIHIIRTARIPFIESHSSPALIATTVIICTVGMTLPFTWAGAALGFQPLPLHAARHHACDIRRPHSPRKSLVNSQVGTLLWGRRTIRQKYVASPHGLVAPRRIVTLR